MIRRTMEDALLNRAQLYPVVTITGPRQSGKSTICRSVFPDKPYVNLEAPDIRVFAHDDPRGFLAAYPDGAILDEIQRAPDLVSVRRRTFIPIHSGAHSSRIGSCRKL